MHRTDSFRAHAIVAGLAALMMATPAISTAASPQASSVAPVKNGVSQVRITLTGGEEGQACTLDHASAKAGPVTFTVTNKTATAITEVELQSDNRILGEKENLAPGLPPVSFTLTLGGGDYQIYCPGAAHEMAAFKVTGKAAPQATGNTAAILVDGTQRYAKYVDGVVDAMVTAVGRLKTDI
ncbi:MAG TPA: peptidase M75, partial [Gammaproteobacteria bacterium]|nr:peptidase M75 [Gammaproteobacteria bacterium]